MNDAKRQLQTQEKYYEWGTKRAKLTVQRIPNNNMVPNASFTISNHYTPFDSIDNGLGCYLFTD
jgi:hypothetical protein